MYGEDELIAGLLFVFLETPATTTASTSVTTAGPGCTDSPMVNCTAYICDPITPATRLYCPAYCKTTC